MKFAQIEKYPAKRTNDAVVQDTEIALGGEFFDSLVRHLALEVR
jgi:hypothetical protein